MQDYSRKSIYEMIEEINDSCFLPDIQRNFVWKPIQVYSLFDSLLRNYPISTFLFWKLKGKYLEKAGIKKLEFVKQSNLKNLENTSINKEKEYTLVLDGQQRLTTFYLVLKGNYIIRNKPYELYFNLISGEEEEDGLLYEFNFYNKIKGKYFFEKDGKGNIEKIWYKVKSIFEITDLEDVADQVTDDINKIEEVELTKEHKKNLSRLYRMLRYEKIIYYYPETEENYDKVLDIFVRTNSGGTQLSYSDLLFSNIKSKWFEAREKFDELLTSINDSERYNFSNDFILKTALYFNSHDVNSLKYMTSNFSLDIINKIKEDSYWIKLNNSIKLSVDLIKDKVFLTHKKLVTSHNALIPIIYWIFVNNKISFGANKNQIDDQNIKLMKTWLVKALLSGVFGGQSDTILTKCKNATDKSKNGLYPGDAIEEIIQKETKKSMKVEEEDIEKISYNSTNSHLFLSLVYKNSINFMPSLEGNIPEQDHIFSQDELARNGFKEDDINTIYNIRFIGRAPNQAKSNLPFEKWIRTQTTGDKKTHLIPNGIWNVKNYKLFINQRKALMIGMIDY
jgi:uncharacterized protein with ParB-like and HNH nuclease domain